MTEKRFNYHIDEVGIYYYVCDNTKKGDDKILFEFDSKLDAMEVCEFLNELHEENEQLKKDVERYSLMINANSDLNDEIYEQLKKTEKNYKSLLKENMQLKSEINMLKNTISRNEAFIERITSNGEWNNTSMKQGDLE